jgi:hypothetical protein
MRSASIQTTRLSFSRCSAVTPQFYGISPVEDETARPSSIGVHPRSSAAIIS